jgi:hypothetical protein
VFDNGIKSTILMIGRTTKRQTGGTFPIRLFFKFLHEAGLADACFTAEQYDLTFALLRSRPPFLQ